MNTGPNGYLFGTATATSTGGVSTATGGASYTDTVTISGPLTDIFRAAVTSTMSVAASYGSQLAAGYAFLFADGYYPDGGAAGSSWTLMTRTITNLDLSATRSAIVFGSALQARGTIVFGASASANALADANNSSAWATTTVTIPTITLYDENGVDITDRFSLTFASGRVVATPEPASLTLLATGLGALALRFRRRRTAGAAS